MQHNTTLHALPSCDPFRIFELRRAAKATGVQFVPSKPKAVRSSTAGHSPFGGAA